MTNKVLITFQIIFGLCFSEHIINPNYALLKTLNDNSSWILNDLSNDSIYISSKKIDGSNLSAIKVEKEIYANPIVIRDILMDVDNYHQFVSNPELFQSKVVDSSENSLVAYQRIIIDVPMIDDRDYFFSMTTLPIEVTDTTILCHWMLLDPNQIDFRFKRDDRITYLKQGAGIWKTENMGSNKIKISYALYMHPGGYIPNFLIDIINESSILNLFNDVLKEINRRKI